MFLASNLFLLEQGWKGVGIISEGWTKTVLVNGPLLWAEFLETVFESPSNGLGSKSVRM